MFNFWHESNQIIFGSPDEEKAASLRAAKGDLASPYAALGLWLFVADEAPQEPRWGKYLYHVVVALDPTQQAPITREGLTRMAEEVAGGTSAEDLRNAYIRQGIRMLVVMEPEGGVPKEVLLLDYSAIYATTRRYRTSDE